MQGQGYLALHCDLSGHGELGHSSKLSCAPHVFASHGALHGLGSRELPPLDRRAEPVSTSAMAATVAVGGHTHVSEFRVDLRHARAPCALDLNIREEAKMNRRHLLVIP